MAGTSFAAQAENQRRLKRAVLDLNKVVTAGKIGGMAALAQIGVELSSAIRLQFRPGTGRIYRRGGVTHRASAPGHPPAVDLGRLRASYTFVLGGRGGSAFVDVGTNVLYAPFLEFGTRFMRPRPHFRPAVLAYTPRLRRVLRDGIVHGQLKALRKIPRMLL